MAVQVEQKSFIDFGQAFQAVIGHKESLRAFARSNC